MLLDGKWEGTALGDATGDGRAEPAAAERLLLMEVERTAAYDGEAGACTTLRPD